MQKFDNLSDVAFYSMLRPYVRDGRTQAQTVEAIVKTGSIKFTTPSMDKYGETLSPYAHEYKLVDSRINAAFRSCIMLYGEYMESGNKDMAAECMRDIKLLAFAKPIKLKGPSTKKLELALGRVEALSTIAIKEARELVEAERMKQEAKEAQAKLDAENLVASNELAREFASALS